MEASDTTTAPLPPPQPDRPLTSEEMLAQIMADQKAHRAEVAQLREEVAQSRAPAPQTTVTITTAEERQAARAAEVAAHPFYCPGCGRLYDYQRECKGGDTTPHPAIDVVSTDELRGDPANHTAAPAAG